MCSKGGAFKLSSLVGNILLNWLAASHIALGHNWKKWLLMLGLNPTYVRLFKVCCKNLEISLWSFALQVFLGMCLQS